MSKEKDNVVVDLSQFEVKTNNSIRNRVMAKKLADPETLSAVNAKGLKDKKGLMRLLGGELDMKVEDIKNMKASGAVVPFANDKDLLPKWAELLEQELPDDKLLTKHNDLLESSSQKIQMEALKEAYKIKGKIAPEKIEHSFRPFEDMEDDELDQKLEEAERVLNRSKRKAECDIIDIKEIS